MRVLFVAELLDISETHLVAGLAESGIEVEVMANALESLPLPESVVRTPLVLHSRSDRAGIRAIRGRLKEGNFDVVHCLRNNRPLANTLWATIGIDVRKVCYRGTPGHVSRFNIGSWFTYFNPRIDRITCVSDAVRRYLLDAGIPKRRLTTIHKGHDPSWYAGLEPVDLTEFGIPREAFSVCAVGRWRPQKGGRVFLESARLLPADGSIHYLLVGETPDPRVEALAQDPAIAPIVHAIGRRWDAQAILGTCDVAVVPTTQREGLPRTMMEAMAQATVPIVTRVGGMPEVVVDGDSGFVVEPGDPDAIAAAVKTLQKDPERLAEMGRRARARIEGEFNIRNTVKKTAAVYEELVSR